MKDNRENEVRLGRREVILGGCAGVTAAALPHHLGNAVSGADDGLASPCIDVRAHGVRADGLTDDYPALQHIFDAILPEVGGSVLFPPGLCLCGGQLRNTAKPLSILGHGQGATRLLFTGETPEDVGIFLDQRRYPNTVQVRNLSLTTNQQETGDALTIQYTEQDVMDMRVVERVFLENVNIAGRNIAEHGFRNGVVLRHVNSPCLLNVSVTGRQPAAGLENRTFTEACFKLIAGNIHESMPVQAGLIKCSGYNARFGVTLLGAHEGLVVTAGNFVECAVGISQNCGPEPGMLPEPGPLPDGGTRPGIWISDTHCNVFLAGVYLQGLVQGFIKDCLFYKAPDADDEDCVGMHLSNCADIKAHHNSFVSHAHTGSFTGIRTEKDTVRCQIFGNTFSLTTASLHLGAGTTGVHAWDNVVQGHIPSQVLDEGSGNWFRDLGKNEWHQLSGS